MESETLFDLGRLCVGVLCVALTASGLVVLGLWLLTGIREFVGRK